MGIYFEFLFGSLLLVTTAHSTFGKELDLPHAVHVNGVTVSYQPYEDTWTIFKETFGRHYNETEDRYRFGLFVQKLKSVEEHNRKYVANQESYFRKVNGFADMRKDEILQRGGCLIKKQHERHRRSLTECTGYKTPTTTDLPSEKDWRDTGCVAPIKDQGDCGACYAFAAVASIETQLCKATGKLTELSEQQVVDCCYEGRVDDDGLPDDGCEGGDGLDVYKDLSKRGGLMSAADNRYIEKDRGNCSFNGDKSKVNVTECRVMTGEHAKRAAVALVGPLYAELIWADEFDEDYGGGVVTGQTCQSAEDVDHCVTIIGYGTEKDKPYWLVKNR